MSKIAGLTGKYIQVMRKKGDTLTYGGDQGFFEGAPKASEDDRKKRMGCGIVAFGDMLLYLAGRNPVYRTEENKHYVNRIFLQEEYKNYYNAMYDFLGGLPKRESRGLSCLRLQHGFNRMARMKKWKLRARWGLNGRKLYDRIIEMLGRDIPVILCVPVLFGRKNKDQGITFFKKEENTYERVCTVSAHYVVITEVVKENDDIFLGISSWGKKYYVNWNEYDSLIHTHIFGTILGNILYIR